MHSARGCVHARNAIKAPGAVARVANGDPCDRPGGWFASIAIRAQALREHASTSHTAATTGYQRCLMLTLERVARALVLRVPSYIDCSLLRMASVLTPILSHISKAAGGAARIAAGMPVGAGCGVGHGAAASRCGTGTGALEPHGCGGLRRPLPSYVDPRPRPPSGDAPPRIKARACKAP